MGLLQFTVSFQGNGGEWYRLTIQCKSLAECLKVIQLFHGKVEHRLIRISIPGQPRQAA